jgi:hypothetical protein
LAQHLGQRAAPDVERANGEQVHPDFVVLEKRAALVLRAIRVTEGVMLPAPGWFKAVDLVGAYLPMAWLAARRI